MTTEDPPNVTTIADEMFSDNDSPSAANSQVSPAINVQPLLANEKCTRGGRVV